MTESYVAQPCFADSEINLNDELSLIKFRLKEVIKKEREGIETQESILVQRNKIAKSLLTFLTEIDSEAKSYEKAVNTLPRSNVIIGVLAFLVFIVLLLQGLHLLGIYEFSRNTDFKGVNIPYVGKVVSFLLGVYLLYVALLLYKSEKNRINDDLELIWKGIRRGVNTNQYTYYRLRGVYYENIRSIIEKVFLNGGIYSSFGVSIALSLIPYSIYRGYWGIYDLPLWSTNEIIAQLLFRGSIIYLIIRVIMKIFSSNPDIVEKGHVWLEQIFFSALTVFSLGFILSGLICLFKDVKLAKFIVVYCAQILSSILIVIMMTFNMIGVYRQVFTGDHGVIKALFLSLSGAIVIFSFFAFLYSINETFTFFIFEEEAAQVYIENLKIFRQLFAISILPILLSLTVFIINFIMLLTKPVANLTARGLYSIHTNNVINRTWFLVLLGLTLCSFLVVPLETVLEVLRIGD